MGSADVRVELKAMARDDFDDVIALELEEAQGRDFPSNVLSIAESTLSPSFHPRAICADGEVVGFLMYQFGEVGDSDEGECTPWRSMIDRRRQNVGIATLAMGLVLEEIRAHRRCRLVDVYCFSDNAAAKSLYARFGFKEVGDRDDGTVIAEIYLQTNACAAPDADGRSTLSAFSPTPRRWRQAARGQWRWTPKSCSTSPAA